MKLPTVLPPMKLRIRDIREAQGKSLDELARLTGMSRAQLGAKEMGKSHIRLIDLQRIAKALEVEVWELVDGMIPPELQAALQGEESEAIQPQLSMLPRYLLVHMPQRTRG